MSITVKLGRKKAVLVAPPPAYPYLGKHKQTGEIYYVVGLFPTHCGSGHTTIRYSGSVMAVCLTGSGKRVLQPCELEPYYEPITLQTVKDQS